eukprot:TRINITY_DN56949_c0_g1_i1.p2 TRINITY_DN56949_c0_g1~~TRINITY_DN56949_c0_g1_i1.p2  ORF type:complete len:116 (-),score=33.13 TRINITY_DN56949_c0_g1_i1:219-566(-)
MPTATEDVTQFEKLKQEVNLAIPQCIEATLAKVTAYHPKQVDEWSESIGQAVLGKLEEMNCNFKYVVNVSIMEKRGAGLHTSSSVFWDPECDGGVSYRWENKALVCIVQAFGIGM